MNKTGREAALIREARLRAGLSQYELAERIGRHRAQVARWEQGVVPPSFAALIEIVRACGFDISLELIAHEPGASEPLAALQQLPPAARLDRMLDELGGPEATSRPRMNFEPRVLLAALERHRAEFVLIGGLARVLRGTAERTAGVDICPSFRVDNLERLGPALAELDARDTSGETPWLTKAGAAMGPPLALMTYAGALNLIGNPAGAPNGFADLRLAATPQALGGDLRPVVASTPDLARLAAALGRPQDLVGLRQLRCIMELAGHPVARGPLRADGAVAAAGRLPAESDALRRHRSPADEP